MATRDDDLRVRPGRIRDRGARAGLKPFVAQVLRAAHKAGHVGPRRGHIGRGARQRRALGLIGDRLLDPSRRVLVKARVVRHYGRRFRSAPLATHVAYLKREGVTRDTGRARMFGADTDEADENAFARRCEADRHHFRFVVSPEDACDMTDLKAFARDLIGEMEHDLKTRLDWIGVDHWNTDNPHIHLLVRGKTGNGRDLVISRDYISRGIRGRAQELVTIELGQKKEHEIQLALEREVDADRWTRLDRAIQRAADETGLIDLRPANRSQASSTARRLLIGRLQRLERMGLASAQGPAQWIVTPRAELALRDLGIRGDIIKTMHRAMAGQGLDRGVADFAIHGQYDAQSIVGRLAAKGLHDELTGEAYVVIDGVDGRAHYMCFPDVDAVAHAPRAEGIVAVRHLAGDTHNRPKAVLSLRSDLSLEAQVTATGATWLDHQLVVREPVTLSDSGFGRAVQQAFEARIDYLVGEGFARRQAQRIIFARDLLETLRRRELDETASRLSSETGAVYRPVAEGQPVAGLYRRRLDLASGRFAMIGDGPGFSLVPWRPGLESHLGKHVSGTAMPGGSVAWDLPRKRGLAI